MDDFRQGIGSTILKEIDNLDPNEEESLYKKVKEMEKQRMNTLQKIERYIDE